MSKKYMFKKICLNFVLVNIIINGVFYIVNFKNHQGILTIDMIEGDIIFGICMLGLLCSATGFINTKKDLLTGSVPTHYYKGAKVLHHLPKSNLVKTALLTGIVMLVTLVFFTIIPKQIGINTINHTIGFLIKTVSAAVSAALIGYIVIVLCTEDYRSLQMN